MAKAESAIEKTKCFIVTLPCANAECQGKFRCCRRFDVGTDTWHSTGPVGPQVHTRDSILLRYFVDGGMLRFLRNRGKRFGNYSLNEARNRLP